MKKINLKPEYKTKIILGSSLLVWILLLVVYIGFFSIVKEETIEANTALSQSQSQSDYFYELSKQKKLVATATKEREKLEGYFINQRSIPIFFEQLELLAGSTNTDYNVISAKESREGNMLTIQVSVNGSFKDVYEFLLGLEDLPLGINIKKIMIQLSDRGELESVSRYPWGGLFEFDIISYSIDA